MFRTASGKLPLSPELAWRRMKVTEKEIMKAIIEKLEPLLEKGISHEEVCQEFIKEQYVSLRVFRHRTEKDTKLICLCHIFLTLLLIHLNSLLLGFYAS